jgi:hypothetical protein
MQVALRVVSGVTILCIVLGLACVEATTVIDGDTVLLIVPGVAFVAFGVVFAFTTAILGVIASAMERQFAWQVAIIVVALIPLIGVPVAETLADQVDPNSLILGGPILVALVVVAYSFRIRDPAAVGTPPRTRLRSDGREVPIHADPASRERPVKP